MADFSDEEWFQLYRELLRRLRELELLEVVNEIEMAAARPVIAETSPEEDARVHAISRDVSRVAVRLRTPEEAFAAAIEVLKTRLVEIPAIARSIRSRLGDRSIVFRESQDGFSSQAEPNSFPLTVLSVDEDQLAKMRAEIETLAAAAASARSL
jgi:hypothetical protein